MSTRRVLATVAGAAGGFAAGSVAGFAVASAYDDVLFGWHDTIGPEIGFSLVSGLACALLGAVLVLRRFRTAGNRS